MALGGRASEAHFFGSVTNGAAVSVSAGHYKHTRTHTHTLLEFVPSVSVLPVFSMHFLDAHNNHLCPERFAKSDSHRQPNGHALRHERQTWADFLRVRWRSVGGRVVSLNKRNLSAKRKEQAKY